MSKRSRSETQISTRHRNFCRLKRFADPCTMENLRDLPVDGVCGGKVLQSQTENLNRALEKTWIFLTLLNITISKYICLHGDSIGVEGFKLIIHVLRIRIVSIYR